MRLILLLFCSLLMKNELTSAQSTDKPNQITKSQSAAMKTYTIRLRPGQDLKAELDAFVVAQRIEAGALLTCVGSLTDLSLRLANQDGPTSWQGHFEIVSLVGMLSTNGSHIHLSAADSTGRTLGGHLMAGCRIYTTAEILIGVMPDLVYAREPDPTYGYRELVVRKKSIVKKRR
jgi:predicted DNA-binding protein with PD1-like motif